jgi:hypothetical protein
MIEIITTTLVSKLEQVECPDFALGFAMHGCEKIAKEQGQNIVERFRYEHPESAHTVVGIKGIL